MLSLLIYLVVKQPGQDCHMGIQLEKTPRLDFVFSGTLGQGRARVSPGHQEQICSTGTKHWSESLWISLSA